jgi:protein-S-isoprenylcysteine O-methyltransferase Ste14
MKIFAISLIVLGAVMLIWTGFTYTKKEKIIDAGPIQVSANREKTVNWPSYAGGILVIAGVVMYVSTRKMN